MNDANRMKRIHLREQKLDAELREIHEKRHKNIQERMKLFGVDPGQIVKLSDGTEVFVRAVEQFEWYERDNGNIVPFARLRCSPLKKDRTPMRGIWLRQYPRKDLEFKP